MTYTALARGFISKSHLHRLQDVQNMTLRLFGGYDRYTRIELLHSDNKIPINQSSAYDLISRDAVAVMHGNQYTFIFHCRPSLCIYVSVL